MQLPRSHLTVLVPVRNGAHLLPAWLDDVGAYADSIIGLDDGSTDTTREVLMAHPLVDHVLVNDVRPTYHGWDDLENRQRLVHAALARGAKWLFFLDADERLDAADGQALRTFLATEAQPGFAYGFQVFRAIDDLEHYDPHSLWVFRLFAAVDAVHPLGSQRLHFVPVPSQIPRKRWLFTSLRIQHRASITAVDRLARFRKYLEADPNNEYQSDYTNLLTTPELVEPWPQRAPGLPVLLGTGGRYVDILTSLARGDWPVLSVVVIAQDDVDVISSSLEALVAQDVDEPIEIIVICSGSDGTYELVRDRFPEARAVQLPARALPGEARNAGLWMARGEYVSFPGSHIVVSPGALAERLRTHEEGWDMVAGSVVNGNTTAAGWASYILDHATKTPSRPGGELRGVPGSASYVTADVIRIGGFPPDVRTGEDTAVNRQLHRAGKRAYFNPRVSFVHSSPCRTWRHLVLHHFKRGQALGRIVRKRRTGIDFVSLRQQLDLPKRRLQTIDRALPTASIDLRRRYRGSVKLLVRIGALSAAAGAWRELVRPTNPDGAKPGVSVIGDRGPFLVLSGRPGEAPRGLLGGGRSVHAAQRLDTLARYARSVTDVQPVLAPIVTSATVTEERSGTFTVDLRRSTVEAYLDAARGVGARLALQLQPGTATLCQLLDRWTGLIELDDVLVYLDLRMEFARREQHLELEEFARALSRRRSTEPIVFTRGFEGAVPGVLPVGTTLDIRNPEVAYPHDVLLPADPRRVLVYE